MALDVRMGDVIEMRRPHPCGGREWEVVRVGSDVGMTCRTCQRRILMDRSTLYRRAKRLVERGAPVDPAIEQALYGTPAQTADEPEA